jgi:polysaccharide biosynthesis/export protein
MIGVAFRQLLCSVLGVIVVFCSTPCAVLAKDGPLFTWPVRSRVSKEKATTAANADGTKQPKDESANVGSRTAPAERLAAPTDTDSPADESAEAASGQDKGDNHVPLALSLPGMAKYDTVLTPPVEPYVLGPGDQLHILDYSFADADKPPMSNHTTVMPDGSAIIYPMGPVQVQGMTLKQVNKLVNRSSSNPEVFVTVGKARPVAVRVLGDVVSPGVYTVDAGLFTSKVGIQQLEGTASDDAAPTVPLPYTALNQTSTITSLPPKVNQLTLLTALQLAGGVHDTANITQIRVSRAFSGKTYFVDLWRLVSQGDITQDIPIRDGDTIFVSRGGPPRDMSSLGVAAERTRRVRVLGSVKKPGIYDMRPDDDLFSAIAKAGGFTDTAVTRSIVLTRKTPEGTVKTQSVPMPGKNLLGGIHDKGEAIARVPLQNGDVVLVTESAVKKIGPKAVTTVTNSFSSLILVVLNSWLITRK